jgi:adenylate cyclase
MSRTAVDASEEPVASAIAGNAADTVLVIDDELAVRDLIQRFLMKEGFRVVLASNGRDGLQLAKAIRPDAVTLDVLMPGMDGWAVLTAMKTDPEIRDIPVIMTTVVDDMSVGYALGAAEYLIKPIDRDRLASVLARFRRDRPILIVDDDADFRQLLTRLLAGEGWTAIEAQDGRAALDRLKAATPAAILLDLMMPTMDGFEFLAALRAEPKWHEIPVLVITSCDLSADDRRRLNGRVEAVLAKGASPGQTLLEEIRSLVQGLVASRRREHV